jgi:hypothetical protein
LTVAAAPAAARTGAMSYECRTKNNSTAMRSNENQQSIKVFLLLQVPLLTLH